MMKFLKKPKKLTGEEIGRLIMDTIVVVSLRFILNRIRDKMFLPLWQDMLLHTLGYYLLFFLWWDLQKKMESFFWAVVTSFVLYVLALIPIACIYMYAT